MNAQSSPTTTGSLVLIPVPLAPDALHTLPEQVMRKATGIKFYFVENIRTARRMLKAMNPQVNIDAIQFSEMNKQQPPDLARLREWLNTGAAVGVMSEAGCPGVADPGSLVVDAARQLNAKIVPMTGPNAMLLALMASGFNGQSFRFSGYPPIKEPARTKALKSMEQRALSMDETQIFIETPYRNNQLLGDLIRVCNKNTRLCIAANITAAEEQIQTRTLGDWERQPGDFHKQPAVFLLGK